MNKRGEIAGIFIISIIILLVAGAMFVAAERGIFAPTVDFVSPTPTGNVSGNYIYANLSTSSSDAHYSFVNFDSDLLLWMRMDDRNSTHVFDNSTYAKKGQILNGTTFVSGKFGESFNGDGIDNYISIPDDSSFDALADNDTMTVCAWIKQYSNDNGWGVMQGVLGQYWATGAHNYLNKSFGIAEGIAGSNKYAIYVSSDGSAWQDAQANSNFSLNTWYHICGTVGGGTVRLYVNGTVQTDTGTVTGIFNAQNTPFTIGTYLYAPAGNTSDSTLFYNGSIDEVLLFKRNLSASEIQAIYNASAYRFANNYTLLANTSHTFTGYAIESDGEFSTTSRTIYTGVTEENDTTKPTIDFASPTETSGDNLSRNYLRVNVTANDTNLANITIYFYNSTSLISSNTTASSPNSVNFTSLSNGTYYFNATAYDSYGNNNSTATRNVSVAYAPPAGSNNSSLNISFVSPTPTEDINETYIYVNVSTQSNLEHYSFVDFDDDLILWMRMDNNNSSYMLDNSSYGNNGKFVNGSSIINGKYGKAFSGDGYGRFIAIPDSSSIDSLSVNDRMTVCSWVYQYSNNNSFGNYQAVIGQWETSTNKKSFGLLEGVAGDGIYGFYITPDGSTYQDAVSNSVLSINTWHHICGVMNGSTANLYVNGVLQIDNGTISSIYNSDVNLTIGYYYTNSIFYNGSIDEVLIFNRALSQNEIRAIYNSSAYASFAKNYTLLTNGSHTFNAYAIDNSTVNSTSRTISSGNASSENLTVPVITIVSPTTQENTFEVIINTNVAASTCYFTDDNGASNVTMLENSTTSFYYEDFDYGAYNITFYCQNTNGTGSLTDDFSFRRSHVETDVHYTNSQGLNIYFDFGFNTTNSTGKTVIIPDSWSALKDATWVTDAENYFLSRGYVAVPVNTRGKGSSQGLKDAFGYECLDIHELVNYLRSNSQYNTYMNGVVYLAGASGAGGKAGVCTAKSPDLFAAGYSSAGVLNLSKWWQTAGGADVAEMEVRVGCGYDECPEAYNARDASYLNYNTRSAVMAWHAVNDDRVTVNCSRDYNRTMNENGKNVSYIEPATGGHVGNFTASHGWFLNYTEERTIPSNGTFKIGVFVWTKNFRIDLMNSSYTGVVDYNITGTIKYFNLTTRNFNGSANMTLFNIIANTNYSVQKNSSTAYYTSTSTGTLSFNLSMNNWSYYEIVVGPVGLYCGDASCNNGETCSTCSGDCGTCSTGGSTGGGGRTKTIITNFTNLSLIDLSIDNISNVIVTPGESKKILLHAKNTGALFLNDCILESRGEYSNWIAAGQVKDLSAGEEHEFMFTLNVPSEAKPGEYKLKLGLVCKEINTEKEFNVEILEEKVGLDILKVEKETKTMLRITYSIKELTGIEQNVDMQFLLYDYQNNKILEALDNRLLAANSEGEYAVQVQVDKNLKGNFRLLANINSETYSAVVEEDVVIGSTMTGLTIFTDPDKKDLAISGIIILFFFGFIFLVIRQIIRNRKSQ